MKIGINTGLIAWQCIFILLKVGNIVEMSWWWVFTPVYIAVLLLVLLFLYLFVIYS